MYLCVRVYVCESECLFIGGCTSEESLAVGNSCDHVCIYMYNELCYC